MARRKIRDEEDARSCLAAARAAGQGPTEWSREHGVDGRSLFAWTKKVSRIDGERRSAAETWTGRRGVVELVPTASPAVEGIRYRVCCDRFAVAPG